MAGIYTVTITNENGCPTVVKVNLKVLFTNKNGQTIVSDDDMITTRNETPTTVYPNPTNDILYFGTDNKSEIEYIIYDVNGKIQSQLISTSNNYISTNHLASGMYQIRWKSKGDDNWNEHKFVKIK